MRAALAAGLFLLVGMLWTAGNAGAADIQDEAAQPYISSAAMEAMVDPLGEDTSCRVEYITSAAFAGDGWDDAEAVDCSPATIPAGDPAQRVTAQLSGLSSDTLYRYRFLATTTSGVDEAEGTFHTFGIEAFTFEAIDAAGDPASAAGSRPYELVTRIKLPHGQVKGADAAAGLAKDIIAELPPGLIGNPTAVEQCPARLAEEGRCSGDSQVGVLKLRSAGPSELPTVFNSQIFNMTPAEGQAARLGGVVNLSTNAYIGASVRTGSDYGINAGSFNLTTISNPFEFEIRIWGVPAASAHDPLRVCEESKGCSVTPGTPEKPFLRNPTRCAGPLQARVNVTSYNLPGTVFSRGFEMPAITGCDQLEFEPALQLQPTSHTADSPTGLHVDLQVPQNEDPTELATPDLRDAVVKLPPGLTINPSSANGLEACTPAQFGLTTPVGAAPIRTTAAPAACPDAAKIGTVEVDTPLLDHSLHGGIFVASPYQNPFNSLLAIYIAVDDDESGVVIKLAGHVEIGPGGQLTTTFAENPQLPFESFKLNFFDGPRAALKTPALCGPYTTTSTLTPWSAPDSGPPARPSDSHQITTAPAGGHCPTSPDQLPNNPSFQAGSESPLAGAFSPFVLNLKRDDGTQQFSSLTVSPPPGLLGKLAGIPYCPDAALAVAVGKTGGEERAAPSCSAASEVGIVNVGAGAGPSPYYVQGRAYLSGPYKGAPLSLAIITPALAGPYDLGTVVVRSALGVNPYTAQITVKSDPIPTELKGIPLGIRSVAVQMSRPNFTLNPTNCETMSIGASLTSTLGQAAPLANRFQVGNCAALAFKPRLNLTLRGGVKRAANPALRAVVRPRPGQANIGRAAVRMPRSAFLDQSHIRTVCTRVQWAADACPKGSVYGWAVAWSPLLDFPLRGRVYLRSSTNQLPDLVADLRGPAHQPIRIELTGRIDSVKGALRSTFDTVPDTPVSFFRLNLFGGKRGLIVNSQHLCARKHRAAVRLDGQNGRRHTSRPMLRNSCTKKQIRQAKQRQAKQRQAKQRQAKQRQAKRKAAQRSAGHVSSASRAG